MEKRLSSPSTRLRLALLGLLVILAAGTMAFFVLGGPEWTLVDSFYMTLITISTVGFAEVHPLSPMLRMVTTPL